jgi:hypothetical protein
MDFSALSSGIKRIFPFFFFFFFFTLNETVHVHQNATRCVSRRALEGSRLAIISRIASASMAIIDVCIGRYQ